MFVGPVDIGDNGPLPDFSRIAKPAVDRESPDCLSRVKLIRLVPSLSKTTLPCRETQGGMGR